MLRFPCLVMDHDDTVVQSERTIGYPYFCQILSILRPGETISFRDYVTDCHNLGFADMCRTRWHFTEQEMDAEYTGWMAYVMEHAPAPFPGIRELLQHQRAEGGRICVVSHSSVVNITRDYELHFGLQPDAVYGWDYPEELRKPNTFPLEDIMKRFGYASQDLLVVDDMKLAWRMAKPLGVKVAFAAWGKLDFPELTQEMRTICDFSFDDPKNLENFLFSQS